MTHPIPGHTEHWRALPNPELETLPLDVTAEMVSQRANDLFDDGFGVHPNSRQFDQVEVTLSEDGTKRMRARIPDSDMRPDGTYYAGIMQLGDIVYAERFFPGRDIQEVYQIDADNPEGSVAFRITAGECEARPLPDALISMIYMLGAFARSHVHGQGHAFYDESFRFASPGLQGNIDLTQQQLFLEVR